MSAAEQFQADLLAFQPPAEQTEAERAVADMLAELRALDEEVVNLTAACRRAQALVEDHERQFDHEHALSPQERKVEGITLVSRESSLRHARAALRGLKPLLTDAERRQAEALERARSLG